MVAGPWLSEGWENAPVDPASIGPGIFIAGGWLAWLFAAAVIGGSLVGTKAQPTSVAATEAVAINAFTPSVPFLRLFASFCAIFISPFSLYTIFLPALPARETLASNSQYAIFISLACLY